MAHGHLLGMGGITTVDPGFEKDNSEDPHGQVLSFDRYKRLSVEKTTFEVPKIITADINDRSKGDFLSKLIAILQTSWFILQCIARARQQLALTELELVTLALASLNAITYAFWWHKPLGVQEPIRIYFRTEVVTEEQSSATSGGRPHNEITVAGVFFKVGGRLDILGLAILKFLENPCKDGLCTALVWVFIGIPISVFLILTLSYFIIFPIAILLLLEILKTKPVTEEPSDAHGLIASRIVLGLRKLRYNVTSYISNVSQKWLRKFYDEMFSSGFFVGWLFFLPALFITLLAITIFFLPFFTFLYLVSFIFTAVFGIITSNTIAPGATHVPAFYAPSTQSDKHSRMIVFALFGVIFGGLHCIGWNFTYPTEHERQLWRATSLAITAIPVIVAPIDFVLENFELRKGPGRIVRFVLDLVMTVLLFMYVPARLSLIAQALALLRNQPQSAFLAVDWTTYIPHIF